MNSIGIKGLIGVEALLYLGYICLDIKEAYAVSSCVKWLSILICFLVITYLSIIEHKKQMIPIALGFSVLSDIFLLFNGSFEMGLCFFIVVQIALMLALHQRCSLHLVRQMGIRFALSIVLLLIMKIMGGSISCLLVLVAFYAIFFSSNIVTSIFLWKKGCKGNGMLFLIIGMLLFFVCDIHVALYNCFGILSMGMWIFYLPGQVMIGISNLLK